MGFEPQSLFMMTILVAVTGYVTKGVIIAWRRLDRDAKPPADRMGEMEERLRKIEVATSSLLVDMTGMREKERFMAGLGESSATCQAQRSPSATGDYKLSPLVTHNIPIIPRAGRTLKY
ncbi:MAG: hypothetical protein WKF55_13435 [Gemmatimonadaceae bacterium]